MAEQKSLSKSEQGEKEANERRFEEDLSFLFCDTETAFKEKPPSPEQRASRNRQALAELDWIR